MLVERIAREVRRASDLAVEEVEDLDAYREVFAPRLRYLGFFPRASEEPLAAARALVATWLSAYSLGAVAEGDPFSRAELWFRGEDRVALPPLTNARARPALRDLPSPNVVGGLLPYLLDPLAPGTRRSVRRKPDESIDRTRRKQQGIYYTPGDVADHMVRACVGASRRTIFDPCCGSGVFLRAALLVAGLPLEALFGADIDPLAADAGAFVLMSSLLERGEPWPSPWAAWQAARTRLATVDSLLLRPGVSLDPRTQEGRAAEFGTLQEALKRGERPGAAEDQEPLTTLGSLFPPLADGVDMVISNPPYAALGTRSTFDPVPSSFASLGAAPVRRTTRAEALFLELAWRLLSERGALSVVLPLSVGTGMQSEYVGLRRAMRHLEGAWDISFFDRAPDALFGDDVKTRNAIFTFRRGQVRVLRTTGLLRWTSWTRRRFLSSIEFVPVEWDTDGRIPKIGSVEEGEVYRALRNLPSCLGSGTIDIATVVPRVSELGVAHTVLVGPTAYNWLACARDPEAFAEHGHSSTSGLTALIFPNADLADAALAVVASRITFWLWRVEGDGFHVTRSFLRDLPLAVHRLPEHDVSHLAKAGRELWGEMRREPIVSVNKGRRTIAFSGLSAPHLLDQVDESVIRAFGVEGQVTARAVRAWHENLIVVDFERRASRPLLAKGHIRAA